MSITLVLAVSHNGVIGINNQLPWKLPNDLKHFKELTAGKTVVMGRKTWDSLPLRFKPLPHRRNIVLSKDPSLMIEGVQVTDDLAGLVELSHIEPLFIIGGSEIYRVFMPYADKIELTFVWENFNGDAFFHDFNSTYWSQDWRLISHIDHPVDDDHAYRYSFMSFERERKSLSSQ